MPPPRFLLDEHIPHTVQSQLLRLDPGIDVLAVGQPLAPPKGISDQHLLKWVENTEYILVSSNRRTIPTCIKEHIETGGHLPGILLIKRSARLGDIIEQLYLLWKASDANEYQDQVLYIPL
ncbi:MAG: hypothetical protein ACNA8H_11245 [Anaerolineales bacterium]